MSDQRPCQYICKIFVALNVIEIQAEEQRLVILACCGFFLQTLPGQELAGEQSLQSLSLSWEETSKSIFCLCSSDDRRMIVLNWCVLLCIGMYPLCHHRASPGGHLPSGPLHRHAIVDELTSCIPDSIHSQSQNAAPPGNLGKPLIYVSRGLLCYHSRINSLRKECITLFTFNGVKTDHHVTLAHSNRITD